MQPTVLTSLTSYPTNGTTWMHVAATYDGVNLKVYINGILDNTKAAILTIAPNETNLGIGAEPATTAINFYQGLLDDVRVYNKVLSENEVRVLAGLAPCYALTLTSGANGVPATALPLKSDACTTDEQYVEGAVIALTAHPDTNYQVGSWSGTDNDSN